MPETPRHALTQALPLTPRIARATAATAAPAALFIALTIALAPLAGCSSADSPSAAAHASDAATLATPETPESQFAAAAKSLDGVYADTTNTRASTGAKRAPAPPPPVASTAAATPARRDASRPPARAATTEPAPPSASSPHAAPDAPEFDANSAPALNAMTEDNTGPRLDDPDQPADSPAIIAPSLVPAPAPPTRSPAPLETTAQKRERLITELAAIPPTPTTPAGPRALADSLRSLLWRSTIQSEPTHSTAMAARPFASRAATLRSSLDPADMRAVDAADVLLRDLAAATDRDRVKSAITEAHAALTSGDTLSIRVAQLCTRVESYGRFTPIATTTLPAGKPLAVLLYTEVDGFTNAQATETPGLGGASDRFTIQLSQELALYSEMGTVVWAAHRQSLKEESRNRRRDYFTTQRVELPASLAPGKYALKLTLRDELSSAVAERTIDLTFVAGEMPKK